MTSVSTLVQAAVHRRTTSSKPLATDLSAAQFLQLGWVYRRGRSTLHCRLGGTPETTAGRRVAVIVSEGDDRNA